MTDKEIAKWVADLFEKSKTSNVAWDTLAEVLNVDVPSKEKPDVPNTWYQEAKTKIGWARPDGPWKKASYGCMSGKRDYCTCDTCY